MLKFTLLFIALFSPIAFGAHPVCGQMNLLQMAMETKEEYYKKSKIWPIDSLSSLTSITFGNTKKGEPFVAFTGKPLLGNKVCSATFYAKVPKAVVGCPKMKFDRVQERCKKPS